MTLITQFRLCPTENEYIVDEKTMVKWTPPQKHRMNEPLGETMVMNNRNYKNFV